MIVFVISFIRLRKDINAVVFRTRVSVTKRLYRLFECLCTLSPVSVVIIKCETVVRLFEHRLATDIDFEVATVMVIFVVL